MLRTAIGKKFNSSSSGGSARCGSRVRFKAGVPWPAVFVFIKMKQKATSQAINNLLSRTTLTTALGTDTPSAWMCNLDTWSQKQLPYPVNKHLPPMRVKSPFIADIIIYYCHVSHQEGLEDSWAHLISTVCLYEKACD